MTKRKNSNKGNKWNKGKKGKEGNKENKGNKGNKGNKWNKGNKGNNKQFVPPCDLPQSLPWGLMLKEDVYRDWLIVYYQKKENSIGFSTPYIDSTKRTITIRSQITKRSRKHKEREHKIFIGNDSCDEGLRRFFFRQLTSFKEDLKGIARVIPNHMILLATNNMANYLAKLTNKQIEENVKTSRIKNQVPESSLIFMVDETDSKITLIGCSKRKIYREISFEISNRLYFAGLSCIEIKVEVNGTKKIYLNDTLESQLKTLYMKKVRPFFKRYAEGESLRKGHEGTLEDIVRYLSQRTMLLIESSISPIKTVEDDTTNKLTLMHQELPHTVTFQPCYDHTKIKIYIQINKGVGRKSYYFDKNLDSSLSLFYEEQVRDFLDKYVKKPYRTILKSSKMYSAVVSDLTNRTKRLIDKLIFTKAVKQYNITDTSDDAKRVFLLFFNRPLSYRHLCNRIKSAVINFRRVQYSSLRRNIALAVYKERLTHCTKHIKCLYMTDDEGKRHHFCKH